MYNRNTWKITTDQLLTLTDKWRNSLPRKRLCMISPIRKRGPKCKGTDIYKRKTLKEMIERCRYAHIIRRDAPANIYHCYKCGHEFDSPFIGPKIKLDAEMCDKNSM
jgi:ribosomal protein L37AE/L43A